MSSAGEEGQTAPDKSALALAEALGETLGEISRRLEEYSAFGKRSRQIIIALSVSFVLDVIITVVLSIVALQAHGTASTNAQLVQELHTQQAALHTEQLASCADGNTFRADQDIIWQDFIRILTTPTATSTKAQEAAADKLASEFLKYVTTVNHAIDCTALYGP
jgi:hypothetical protein